MVGVTLLKVIKTIPLFIETTEKKKKRMKGNHYFPVLYKTY